MGICYYLFMAYSRETYLRVKNDPERHERRLAHTRKSRIKVQQWLDEYKLSNGCIDCGYKDHSCALELDHTGVKQHKISNIRSSVKRLQKEIEEGQCVVRCGNCHAIKTYKERKLTPSNAASRKWLREYKENNGCFDCGYNEHYSALQLDHLGTKNVEISKARSSIKRLKEEIAAGECQVVCVRCHSIRTKKRKQIKSNDVLLVPVDNTKRGSNSSAAKLNETQVIEIRHKIKFKTQKELAKEYGVSRTCIEHIVNRNTWRHV